MISRDNLIGSVATLGLIATSVIIDKSFHAIRLNAGQTFNFRASAAAQLGFALLVTLLVILYLYLLLIRLQPDRWVFGLGLATALIILVPFILTYIFPFDLFFELWPHRIRTPILLLFTPVTFTTHIITTLFWSSVIGLIRKPRTETSPN